MLARLLFAAVALPLIGALPDAHASRAVGPGGLAERAPALAAPAPAPSAPATRPHPASAPSPRAR